MVGHQVGRGSEPVAGHRRQDPAAVGDEGGQNTVESGDTVSGDHQQPFAEVEGVPDLAPPEKWDSRILDFADA